MYTKNNYVGTRNLRVKWKSIVWIFCIITLLTILTITSDGDALLQSGINSAIGFGIGWTLTIVTGLFLIDISKQFLRWLSVLILSCICAIGISWYMTGIIEPSDDEYVELNGEITFARKIHIFDIFSTNQIRRQFTLLSRWKQTTSYTYKMSDSSYIVVEAKLPTTLNRDDSGLRLSSTMSDSEIEKYVIDNYIQALQTVIQTRNTQEYLPTIIPKENIRFAQLEKLVSENFEMTPLSGVSTTIIITGINFLVK